MRGSYWRHIVAGASSRGLKVGVTKDDVWLLFQQQGGRCALSGVPIVMGPVGTMTASLDRKDSSQGYVAGNLQWVHKAVNRMKGTLSDVEFTSWCRAIAVHGP